LVCVGTVGSIGKLTTPKEKDDGTVSPYHYEEIEIRPQAGGTKAKLRLMWAADWFRAAYASEKSFKGAMADWAKANPRVDKDGDTVEASSFVFEKNISAPTAGKQSFLEGLCGGSAEWESLQSQLTDSVEPKSAATVHEIIANFLQELGPVPFLYTLRQERRNGVAGEYYEVDEIRHLTEKNLKALVKRAESAAEKIAKGGSNTPAPWIFKLGDPADLGLNVELPAESEPSWVTA